VYGSEPWPWWCEDGGDEFDPSARSDDEPVVGERWTESCGEVMPLGGEPICGLVVVERPCAEPATARGASDASAIASRLAATDGSVTMARRPDRGRGTVRGGDE